jgi:hypothetical protein
MEDTKPMIMPLEPHLHLYSLTNPDKGRVQADQNLVGVHMYAAYFICSDIACTVNQCDPGPSHILAAKRILQHLAGTKHVNPHLHR